MGWRSTGHPPQPSALRDVRFQAGPGASAGLRPSFSELGRFHLIVDGHRLRRSGKKKVEDVFAREVRCLVGDLAKPLLLHHVHREVREIADDGFHIAPHVSDFCELGRFTLMNGASERSASLRAISVFPTPVGPIMMMFVRHDLATQFIGHHTTPPAVPEGDGNRFLGFLLADDVLVEFGTICLGVR